ncbi:MAG: sigma-70 family RNA polymerase sigma factor [Erysipelotrichaceae bacterium]|uniref:RNA polymerase sigma factor n=1 Tax=Anaerorhabdus sp. TaxID=1872524 RepID=UPI002FC797AC
MNKNYNHLTILLNKVKNGDEKAFEEIYTHTIKGQYFLALKTVKNEELAKEVIQEVYIKLYRYINKIENSQALIAYMNKMNFSISIDVLRKNNKDKEVSIDCVNTDELTQKDNSENDKELLYQALDTLDNESKEIIILKYIDGIKIKDIAAYKKTSTRTIERKLKKSLIQLRKIISKENMFNFLPFFMFPGLYLSYEQNKIDNLIFLKIYEDVTASVNLPIKQGKLTFLTNQFDSFLISCLKTTFGLSAALVLGISFLPPKFLVINQNKDIYEDSKTFLIQQDGIKKNSNLTVVDSDGNAFTYEGIDKNNQIVFHENGNYTLTMKNQMGLIYSQQIEVSMIDKESPEFIEIKNQAGEYIFKIIENETILNIDSLIIESDNKELVYEILSKDKNYIEIKIISREMDVSIKIKDAANNYTKVMIQLI